MNTVGLWFANVEDPRVQRTKKHLLLDIIILSICAVICGADGWDAIRQWGEAKEEWLKTFLTLKNGIPSADTIRRVFEMIDPKQFAGAFYEWMADLHRVSDSKLIAIDGKTLRGSLWSRMGIAALHMVHAWASDDEVLLGQIATDAKSNEITAIPQLLKLLSLNGALVTLDAMGCQKEIVEEIVGAGADYIVTVKDNQLNLHEQLQGAFEARGTAEAAQHSVPVTTEKKKHGRVEHRSVLAMKAPDWLDGRNDWKKIESIVCVTSTRTEADTTTEEKRFFISSVKAEEVIRIGHAIRKHWGVENGLHWTLDVTFGEDRSQIAAGNGGENFATLRRIALNLFKQDKRTKGSVAAKRRSLMWNHERLLELLAPPPALA